MSIHAVAETSLATPDAQVIADMAAEVLASIARIHADGVDAVTTLAEAPRPVRVELPAVVEAVAEIDGPEAAVAQTDEEAEEDEPVVRMAVPFSPPVPRSRHAAEAEAVTDEIAVQTAA